MSDWETLGAVDPRRLIDARLQLHWAAQPACAVGKLLAPPQPDFSQQSFQWREGERALPQSPIPAPTPFRSAVRPSPPALTLLAEGGGVLAELPLHGQTLDEAYAWTAENVERLLERPLPGALERPEGLPDHPVAHGAPFDTRDAAAFAELGRYFAGAHRLLEALADRTPGASPVRCWPHHFDIATLIQLGSTTGDTEAEAAPTIGIGMSPGDGTYDEPYFYVTPWPYPENPALSALPSGGTWHREGWLGAVLLAEAFVGASTNGAQHRRIQEFLDAAVTACRELIKIGR
jgi:hypothetical protein